MSNEKVHNSPPKYFVLLWPLHLKCLDTEQCRHGDAVGKLLLSPHVRGADVACVCRCGCTPVEVGYVSLSADGSIHGRKWLMIAAQATTETHVVHCFSPVVARPATHAWPQSDHAVLGLGPRPRSKSCTSQSHSLRPGHMHCCLPRWTGGLQAVSLLPSWVGRGGVSSAVATSTAVP